MLDTVCTVGDTVVIDGEALLMVSRRAEIVAAPRREVPEAAEPAGPNGATAIPAAK